MGADGRVHIFDNKHALYEREFVDACILCVREFVGAHFKI